MDAFNDFQLHNEAAFDQQVQFERAANALALVLEGDTPLALDTKLYPLISMIMQSRYTDSNNPGPRVRWTSMAQPMTLSVSASTSATVALMRAVGARSAPAVFLEFSRRRVPRLAVFPKGSAAWRCKNCRV